MDTFNRTSMELKQGYVSREDAKREPFNRTSMELKRRRIKKRCEQRIILLIEPVWN